MLTDDHENDLRDALAQTVGSADGAMLTLAAQADLAARTGATQRDVQAAALRMGIVPACYARNLGTLGADGQARLLAARALIVGLGGLGGHVVETLARLGVGRIAGADDDAFAESDLNRQLLAETGSLGRPKADEAARRVSRVNPAVTFTACPCRFEQLGDDAFAGCQAVFDCLDSIPARLALAERCASAGVWLVHGAVAGWAGQVALCRPGDDTLARIYAGPKRGLEQRLGNLPFTVAVTANLMASRAMPLLLGRPADALARQVLFFDLLDNDWQTVDL
jgi:molybdopterin/thiamine biosynthesis adenylyltransferase